MNIQAPAAKRETLFKLALRKSGFFVAIIFTFTANERDLHKNRYQRFNNRPVHRG